ncbi:tetratricopeptide repeat protein [Arsukibacterium sp.]
MQLDLIYAYYKVVIWHRHSASIDRFIRLQLIHQTIPYLCLLVIWHGLPN